MTINRRIHLHSPFSAPGVDFSIVIAVFNTAEHLEACVGSILGQSVRDFELILIDDGSTDSSWELCQKFAGMDVRVRACRQEHQGPSAARNLGLAMATGDYITFIDSDDVITPGTLDIAKARIISHQPDLIIFSMLHVRGAGSAISRRGLDLADKVYASSAGFFSDLLERRRLLLYSAANKMYRRALLERHAVRFPVSIDFGEDRLFNFACLGHAQRIITSSHIAYHYFIRPTPSLSQRFRSDHVSELLSLHDAKRQVIDRFARLHPSRDTYLDDDLALELRAAFAHLIRHWRQLPSVAKRREITHLITAPYPRRFLQARQSTFNRRLVHLLIRHRLAFILRLIVTGAARFTANP